MPDNAPTDSLHQPHRSYSPPLRDAAPDASHGVQRRSPEHTEPPPPLVVLTQIRPALTPAADPAPSERTQTHAVRRGHNPQGGDSSGSFTIPSVRQRTYARSVGGGQGSGDLALPVAPPSDLLHHDNLLEPLLLDESRPSAASKAVIHVVPEMPYTAPPAPMYATWAFCAAVFGGGTALQLDAARSALGALISTIAYPLVLVHGFAEAYFVRRQERRNKAENITLESQLKDQEARHQIYLETDKLVKDTRIRSRRPIAQPSREEAAATLHHNALTTRLAHTGLSRTASSILKIRDLQLQSVATLSKGANWLISLWGVTSAVLNVANGVFGVFAGALHIVQGAVERKRALQAGLALQGFHQKVIDSRGQRDAGMINDLKGLDASTTSPTKPYRGERPFHTLLSELNTRGMTGDLMSVGQLTAFVRDKLQRNTADSIRAATQQIRYAWIRMGVGGVSAVASLILTGLAAAGIVTGLLPVLATLVFVAGVTPWLIIAVFRLRQAHRDTMAAEREPLVPRPEELPAIDELARRDLDKLELNLEADCQKNRFHSSVLLARYLALSSKLPLVEHSANELYAQRMRAKVATRLLRLAGFTRGEIRALRILCQQTESKWFTLAVTIIHSHVIGQAALEREVTRKPSSAPAPVASSARRPRR